MKHQGQANPLSLFHGLRYLTMWAGRPCDSPVMGQLPLLPATWKWVALSWRPISVANMYCVESIILFNLASPTTTPTFVNEMTAKSVCFGFSYTSPIISKCFHDAYTGDQSCIQSSFFNKTKFSLSVEEIESHETLSKNFSGSAVAFSVGNWQGLMCEWRQRKPVSSRSYATERLLVHMSEKKCANLPSTPNRVCLPETHEVWCILGT